MSMPVKLKMLPAGLAEYLSYCPDVLDKITKKNKINYKLCKEYLVANIQYQSIESIKSKGPEDHHSIKLEPFIHSLLCSCRQFLLLHTTAKAVII